MYCYKTLDSFEVLSSKTLKSQEVCVVRTPTFERSKVHSKIIVYLFAKQTKLDCCIQLRYVEE